MGEMEDDDAVWAVPHQDNLNLVIHAVTSNVQSHEALMTTISSILKSDDATPSFSLEDASASLAHSISDLIQKYDERERWFRDRLGRLQAEKKEWEDNLRLLAVEHNTFKELAVEEVGRLSNLQKTEEPAEDDFFYDAEDYTGTHSLPPVTADFVFKFVLSFFYHAIAAIRCSHNFPGFSSTLHLPNSLNPPSEIADPSPFPQSLLESSRGYKLFRSYLPPLIGKKPEMSIWSVLKNNIGRDLSKIALPVFFNEPLSMLQVHPHTFDCFAFKF